MTQAPTSSSSQWWVTLDEMRVLCPDCAKNMDNLHIEMVDVMALRKMPESLMRGLCDKFGGPEGFFSKCRASSLSGQVSDKEAFCAWLKHQCHGTWPGQKKGMAMDEEDTALVLSELLVAEGGPLKALPNGRVEGYLVIFSPEGKERDLVGDYFKKQTDFGWKGIETRPALYHHGLDPVLKKRRLGGGWEFGHIDDIGLWVQMQLDLRDEYEKAIYDLVGKKKLGLSSGTATHMIERESNGFIKSWTIVEGSYTPTPAEPRTLARAIRSLDDVPVIPLKSVLEELLSDIERAREAPTTRGKPSARRRWRQRYSRRLMTRNQQQYPKGAKTMMYSVEDILAALKDLIPSLSEDQAGQIAQILRIGFGEPIGAEISEDLEPEVRSYFGFETTLDPWKMAANADDVLTVIQEVCDLDEDQLAKIASVLNLALASAESEGEYDEEMMDEEPLEDEEEFEDDDGLDLDEEEEILEPEEEIEVRSLVYDILDREGIYGEEEEDGDDDVFLEYEESPRSLRSYPSRATRRPTQPSFVSRPPYSFRPREEESEMSNSRKAVARLRFGEPDPAIRTIARDLYGRSVDYEQLKYDQLKAFGQYVRRGALGLDRSGTRLLKQVILTVPQIKAAIRSGVDVSSLKADMSEIVDQLGGFLVPEDIRMDMVERLPGLTVVRRYAEILPTSSDMMTRVKVTGGDSRYTSAVRVTWVGDIPAAGSADTRPTFSAVRTPVHIAKATVHVPMSLLEDTPFPLVDKLSEWASEGFAIDEDEQFLIGTGIAKPEGILPDSANGNSLTEAITGDADEITFDGVKNLRYAVKRQYRQGGAVFIMTDQTALETSKLKDAEGRYLWEVSNQAGEPDRLLGYPVETTEAMPEIAASAYPMLFGNLKMGYQIGDRIGMSLIRDEVTQAEQDLIKFIFRRRLGGQVKQEAALAVLKVSAS